MMNFLSNLLKADAKPQKGLFAVEWISLGYLLLTTLFILFTYTKLPHPDMLLWERLRIVLITAILWGLYHFMPCRLTCFARIAAQFIFLAWWYPDTYELNCIFPNLDHYFAWADQYLFNCQPALLFHQKFSSPIISEIMDMSYAAYFPMIALTALFYFTRRYNDFQWASFVIISSFFAYYLIFVALPVTGPQYYYPAAGMENIARGIFPNLGNYFETHMERMTSPGWSEGFFYQMVANAHDAGERPTAAFPSSHVGITTIIMILAWKSRNKKLFYTMLPIFVIMCFATVYIMAHYVVDVIGGLVTGVLFYLSANAFYRRRESRRYGAHNPRTK